MLRSMFAGVSGLRNHQLKMDVLSNNISNVNTVGYKAGRVCFQEIFTQTLTPAAPPTATNTLGGVNPKQIGLGSATAAIDVIHTIGAMQTTDRALDVMITGEGFFMVRENRDNNVEDYFTRAGNLYLDSFGYLVTANGQYLQGIMMLDEVEYEDLDEAIVERLETDADAGLVIWGGGRDDVDQLNDLSSEDSDTYPVYLTDETRDDFEDRHGRIVVPLNFQNIAIDANGVVTGVDANDVVVPIAVIPTATFVNPAGLTRVGDNLYQESNNSGIPSVAMPGMATNGTLRSGTLEMSNVDLSESFTDMIITQRGFQANSRVITVSDTLLEELINLKR